MIDFVDGRHRLFRNAATGGRMIKMDMSKPFRICSGTYLGPRNHQDFKATYCAITEQAQYFGPSPPDVYEKIRQENDQSKVLAFGQPSEETLIRLGEMLGF